jgi:hypothetical protein
VSPILEASPRSEKIMSTTDQVTAMCQQMSLELAFLTNSTANEDFPEKLKLNDPKSIGRIISKFYLQHYNAICLYFRKLLEARPYNWK